jgi:ADP-heptose:LPS heptosyltransferase
VALTGRLVVLRALGLGDLLTAVPALRALADAFPSHERILAAPQGLAPLVALVDRDDGSPAIHRTAHTAELAPLGPELAGSDVAVNLHGRGPQSHRVLQAARPRRTLWFHCPEIPQSAGAPAWRAHEHEVERWCRMLSENGVPADPSRMQLAPPEGTAPPAAAGATLIHPGAASGARRWPAERFSEVAAAERARSRPVVLTGTPGEAEICRGIARRAGLPPEAVLAGRTDLADLARSVAAADRVICGDTGVAHLATALGTPSVVLFGPVPPSEWGPPPQRHQHRVLWAGRTGDPHASRPDPGLLEIRAAEAIAALEELPGRRSVCGNRVTA